LEFAEFAATIFRAKDVSFGGMGSKNSTAGGGVEGALE